MSCILIRCTYDKSLEMIQPAISSGVIVPFVFLVPFVFSALAHWWSSQELDCTEIWSELLLPGGTYIQSFGSIAPAFSKRALQTDDGGRQTPRDCIGSLGEPKIHKKC
jgi:hypothetical protein